ncbi:hypothetical protein ACBG90_13240 [Stutzerimonas kunmingensis]|uniref:hypothetical protein n=1 Tax=Stutzerimonas kunmingensis TaxID=1211807 RepID=UPI003525D617
MKDIAVSLCRRIGGFSLARFAKSFQQLAENPAGQNYGDQQWWKAQHQQSTDYQRACCSQRADEGE